ncbi:MAG: hypothetical protein GX786_04090 [Clostridiales bacterium]|nr:hypothetical protein [Clostridiales bacterium]
MVKVTITTGKLKITIELGKAYMATSNAEHPYSYMCEAICTGVRQDAILFTPREKSQLDFYVLFAHLEEGCASIEKIDPAVPEIKIL